MYYVYQFGGDIMFWGHNWWVRDDAPGGHILYVSGSKTDTLHAYWRVQNIADGSFGCRYNI